MVSQFLIHLYSDIFVLRHFRVHAGPKFMADQHSAFSLYFFLFCSTQIGFISVLTVSLYSQPFQHVGILPWTFENLVFSSLSSIWFEFPIHNKLLDWTCEHLGPTQFFCSRHTDQINDVNTTSFFNLDIEQFHLTLVILGVFFSAHRWTLISAPIGSLTIVSYTQVAEDKPVGKWRMAKWWNKQERPRCFVERNPQWRHLKNSSEQLVVNSRTTTPTVGCASYFLSALDEMRNGQWMLLLSVYTLQ